MSLSRFFDDCRHRAGAAGNSWIGAVAVDAVLMRKHPLFGSGLHNRAPLAVDHAGKREGLGGRIAEDMTQELDDVFVGVVVIVEENQVVERLERGLARRSPRCLSWRLNHRFSLRRVLFHQLLDDSSQGVVGVDDVVTRMQVEFMQLLFA